MPGAQHFGNAPGLRKAAARGVRRAGVKNLTYRAHAGIMQMGCHAGQKLQCMVGISKDTLMRKGNAFGRSQDMMVVLPGIPGMRQIALWLIPSASLVQMSAASPSE